MLGVGNMLRAFDSGRTKPPVLGMCPTLGFIGCKTF